MLGLAATPVYLRLLRADMIQNLQQDYVSVAKAKGMSNTHILVRHVLRPSTVTLMTVLGLNIAQLVNGAIVVEFIFDFDGMGSYLIEAVARREFFAVQTIVALVAALFVLTNTVIDVLYTVVDPRVKATAEHDQCRCRDRRPGQTAPTPARSRSRRELGVHLVSRLAGRRRRVRRLGDCCPFVDDPDAKKPAMINAGPELGPLFGNDSFGQDVFSRWSSVAGSRCSSRSP